MSRILNTLKNVLKSPGLRAVYAWSGCVHSRVVIIWLITAVTALTSLGNTIATKGLVDGAVSGKLDRLIQFAVLLGLLILTNFGLMIIRSYVRMGASADLQLSMQKMLVTQLLSKDYACLKDYHSGELVNRIFSDVMVVKQGIMHFMPTLISVSINFIGAAVILIVLDWHFIILMLLGGFCGLVLILLFRNPMKNRHRQRQEAEGKLHASIQETLEGIRLIKASVTEERSLRRIGTNQQFLHDLQIKQWKQQFWINSSMDLIFNLSWLFCMVWGCLNIFRGNLTYGSMAAMLQLIGRIQGPIENAISMASEVYGVTASAERLLELTELPSEEETGIMEDFDEIRLNNITFRYDDGMEEVLQSINWTIRKGDFMALTGMSGGGKTSLFHLMLGIYKPTSGSIEFCLGDQKMNASRGTRKLFAYVPQGNMLFSGTLKDNLTMFREDASEEEIQQAVHAACLDNLVEEIGLEAVLGEHGMGLSEGQAQRVAVARALLSNAPILLLDEATSALDEKTEKAMLENISAQKGKTCIIVTHRRAALDICDYTLHLADGKVQMETF